MILGSIIAIATIFYLRWKTYQNKVSASLCVNIPYEIEVEVGNEFTSESHQYHRLKIRNDFHVKHKQGAYIFEITQQETSYSCVR